MRRKVLLPLCLILVVMTVFASVGIALAVTRVTGITLNATNLTLAVGKTVSLSATISPSNASNRSVTYVSSNTGVATVSQKGAIKAIKAGTATITAKSADGKATAKCKVTVVKKLKEIKITYATFIGEGDKDMVGICIKPYMDLHPNVKIVTQVYEHEAYQQKLPIMANSNTLPDLFWWNGTMIIDAYKNTKSIADLTPYFDAAFKKTLSPAAFPAITTKDGKIVAFPADMSVQGFMYNKALFDKYGLQIPKTYDDLKNVVKVFKKNNVIAIAQGTKTVWPYWQFQNWLMKLGIRENAQALFNTEKMKIYDADSPFVAFLNKVADLHDIGAFPENASTLEFEQMVALFTSGKAAIVNLPTDQLGKVIGTPVEKDCIYEFGITFPDSKYPQNFGSGGVGNAYGVSANVAKDADKMAAMIDFNKWRYSEAGFALTLKTGSILPCIWKPDVSSFGKIMQEQIRMQNQVARGEITMDAVNPAPDYVYYNIWDNNWEAYGSKFQVVWQDIFLGLVNGSITKSEIIDQLKKGQVTLDTVIKDWKAHKK